MWSSREPVGHEQDGKWCFRHEIDVTALAQLHCPSAKLRCSSTEAAGQPPVSSRERVHVPPIHSRRARRYPT